MSAGMGELTVGLVSPNAGFAGVVERYTWELAKGLKARGHRVVLLAGHGTKEQWRTLGWVKDFALLIERRPGLDWAAIHYRAEARGCGGSVILGALLARDLLGIDLPPALGSLAAADRRSTRKAAALISRLELGLPEPESLPNFSDLDLCDRQLDRVKAVLGLAFTPTAGDYSAMPLPPALWGLYRLTRPFRLAAKAARLV